MTDTHQKYAYDTTTSVEAIEQYRASLEQPDDAAAHEMATDRLSLLHFRGGQAEFDLGASYCQSSDPLDRVTGAAVLSQLGSGKQTFQSESVALLLPLLQDSDEFVVQNAAIALGHRSASEAIAPLVARSDDPSAAIRFGVVCGLSGQDDPAAIEALIKLSQDKDPATRDYAVFALSSQTDADTPALRDALYKACLDKDHEIRGEALVGLASRGDERAYTALRAEWKRNQVSLLSLRAAALLGDPRCLRTLQEIEETVEFDHEADPDFFQALADAIEACGNT